MLLTLVCGVALVILLRQEVMVIYRILLAQLYWVSTPAKIIVAQRVRRPWHASKPYRRPRHIAAARITDDDSRDIVVDRLTLAPREHAAARQWVNDHHGGEAIRVHHPRGRPDLGILLPPAELWFQLLWRAGYCALVVVAVLVLLQRGGL